MRRAGREWRGGSEDNFGPSHVSLWEGGRHRHSLPDSLLIEDHGRKDPHCGEEGVNLVLITALSAQAQRHAHARSVEECLVGSVTRDLGRKGRPGREGIGGRERIHTSATLVEHFDTYLFPFSHFSKLGIAK